MSGRWVDEHDDERYGRDGYGQDGYGQDRYGQDRYGQDRYGQDRYGQDRYDQDRYDDGWYDDRYPPNRETRRRSAPARALQGLSGALTAGVVLLAVGVIVTAFLGSRRGFPGPGAVSVAAHVVAAGVAVAAQRLADHRRGGVALIGSVVVLFVTVALLWTQWWS